MRKPDPERIYLARRAAVFHRLVDKQRLYELDAEHWIATLGAGGNVAGLERHSGAFWEEGQVWIGDGRRRR